MSAPTRTLSSLQNKETGIDITVPRYQEEEAPLGGTSLLYEISVFTNLALFKTRLHRNEDIVQFSIYKAYREVEDLYNKLNKKYPKAGLPSIPRASNIDKYSKEERVAALNGLMQAIGKDVELCHSSIFTHFIGINSQRLPSFTVPDANLSTDKSQFGISEESAKEKISEDFSEIFPKIKNVNKSKNKVDEVLPIKDNVDLFEEVKLIKENEKPCDTKNVTNTGGLFDDLEEDDLFTAKTTSKPISPPKQEKKMPEIQQKKKLEKKTTESIVDDSEIIIKERKLGNISLFDEQDFGDYITKDEEPLFLVTTNANEKSKRNDLLFSNDSVASESDFELHENLDDLLNLNPLPPSPASKKTALQAEPKNKSKCEEKEVSIEGIEHQPKRPVPLPRKKSLGKNDTDEQYAITPPEVMPRKVFLTKPEVPKKTISTENEVTKFAKPPPISAKPVVLNKSKPAVPNKPKPPPKPTVQKDSKNLDAINANEPSKLENQTSVSSFTDDLNKMDILKYIEEEQKTLQSEPSLFD